MNCLFGGAVIAVVVSLQAISGAQAVELTQRSSHIVRSAPLTNTVGLVNADHSTHLIEVQVQGASVTRLTIALPETVNLTQALQVTDQTDQPVTAAVTIANHLATVEFAQPIAAGTTLHLALQGVSNSAPSETVLYRLFARSVGATTDIPLGTAPVRTYSVVR